EALEGFFGDNMRLVDGKLEIVRPDGAVWLQDGMVASDYTISGYDPYLMDYGKIIDSGTGVSEFKAFDDSSFGNWYTQTNGVLDGRGEDNNFLDYEDIRDPSKNYTIRFQRYEFIHTARYLKF